MGDIPEPRNPIEAPINTPVMATVSQTLSKKFSRTKDFENLMNQEKSQHIVRMTLKRKDKFQEEIKRGKLQRKKVKKKKIRNLQNYTKF